MGLRTWDKPSGGVPGIGLPYGTPVTLQRLARVERAEAGLRALGFRELRVRHYGDTARLEVALDGLGDRWRCGRRWWWPCEARATAT